MNFKVGQKVVCVSSGNWERYDVCDNQKYHSPKKDEVVTVRERKIFKGESYISFQEYPDDLFFFEKDFRPLDELTSYGINDLIETLPFEERKVTINI